MIMYTQHLTPSQLTVLQTCKIQNGFQADVLLPFYWAGSDSGYRYNYDI